MDNQIRINVQIAEKHYPIFIDREDEALAREAGKRIQNLVVKYQQAFPEDKISSWDALAMAAFQVTVQNLQLMEQNDTAPYTNKIQELTLEIKRYLENK